MAKKVATGGTTALAKWNQQLADMAKAAKKAVSKIGGVGNFISLKGGVMTYRGGIQPENKMKAIVVDAVLENQYYSGAFDPDNFASPDCYAFGRDPDTMAPNPEYVENPVNPTCSGCPNNEWGSADVGKGKACKEVQRLAIITEGDMDDIENAEIAFLKVPVTSSKAWAGYVRSLDDAYHYPPLAFITEISVVKENTNKLPGWHVDFKLLQQIEDGEVIAALMEKFQRVSKDIIFPYPKMDQVEEQPTRRAPAPKAKAAKPKAPARAAIPLPAAAMSAAGTPVKVGLRRPAKVPKF